MTNQIQIPEGHYLKKHVSYEFPKCCNSIEMVIIDVTWWQFWRPKHVYIYETLEKKKGGDAQCINRSKT